MTVRLIAVKCPECGAKGSVIIEFKPAYLETLSEGSHKVHAVFDDGSADAELIITKKASDSEK